MAGDVEDPDGNILVVEDHAQYADFLRSALSHFVPAARVEVAANLGEAINSLTAGAFDIVLLDLYLPDSKGLDSCKIAMMYSGSAQIIILTGYGDADMAKAALEMGANGFLFKQNTTLQVIGDMIGQIIRSRKVFRNLRSAIDALRMAADRL